MFTIFLAHLYFICICKQNLSVFIGIQNNITGFHLNERPLILSWLYHLHFITSLVLHLPFPISFNKTFITAISSPFPQGSQNLRKSSTISHPTDRNNPIALFFISNCLIQASTQSTSNLTPSTAYHEQFIFC